MAVVIASAHLDDEEFLAAFSSGQLGLSSFRHGDHLRFSWLQLHRMPFAEALKSVREGIRRFAAQHGRPHIFHETVTAAWVTLLATHREASFAEFVERNAYRLNIDLLHRFWSPAALQSEAARVRWLPPDREALPH